MSKSIQRQVLEQARDLLSDPEKWTKGAFAIDQDGEYMDFDDANGFMRQDNGASCEPRAFCAVGSVRYVSHKMGFREDVTNGIEDVMADALDPEWRERRAGGAFAETGSSIMFGYDVVAAFQDQDGTTHRDVLNFFDRLIAKET